MANFNSEHPFGISLETAKSLLEDLGFDHDFLCVSSEKIDGVVFFHSDDAVLGIEVKKHISNLTRSKIFNIYGYYNRKGKEN